MNLDNPVGKTAIDWEALSPAKQVIPTKVEATPKSRKDEELLLEFSGLGLKDVTGTKWTTAVGEKKYVASAGEVKAAGLLRKFLVVNNQLLVTDDRGKVYLGDALNPKLQQHLQEKGYTELVDNPAGVGFYVPQATDAQQV